MTSFTLLFLSLSFHFSSLFSQPTTVIIPTSLGKVEGNKVSIGNNKYIYEFLGLRYANPTLGSLRFRPSNVYNTPYNTTYNATQYPCGCPQYTSFDPSVPCTNEDCLFLNIFTPSVQNNSALPVMVWIHGGGYIWSASSSKYYYGDNFISKSNGSVILVTINYRLGPLGFLQSKQLYSEDPSFPSYGGMNGIGDQITALKWIKQNIEDFGGNPNNVTVFGESAGGLSLCMLLISPEAKSLFNGAIIESGDCSGPWGPFSMEYGLNYSTQQILNAGFPNNITFLRQLDANELLALEGNVSDALFFPSVDGVIMTDMPRNIYYNLTDASMLNAKSVIFGFNSQDGTVGWPWFYGNHPNSDSEYKNDLKLYTTEDTIINSIYNIYYPPTNFQNSSVAWYAINADTCVVCSTLDLITTLSHNLRQNLSLRVYYFRSANTNNYLAPHFSEIPFVFDHSSYAGYYSVVWDQALSDGIISAWSTFGVNQKPVVKINKSNIEWLEYNGNISNVLILDNNIRMVSNFWSNYRNENVCGFWDTMEYSLRYNLCWNVLTPASNVSGIH